MLPLRDRRILVLLVLLQISLSVLDLLGVALIGVVVVLATQDPAAPGPGGVLNGLISFLPNSQEGFEVPIWLAVAAGLILVAKSVLSFLVTRRTFRFLANRQAMVSGKLASELLGRPLLDLQRRTSQETTTTLTRSVSQLTMGVLGGSVIALSEAGLLAILLAALVLGDPATTIFAAFFFALVAIAVQKTLSTWAHRIGVRAYEAEVGSMTAIQEAIRSYREITVMGRRRGYIEQFRGQRWKVAASEADLRLVNIVTKYIYEVALVIGGGLLAGFLFSTRETPEALAVLAIFIAAASRLLPSVMRLQTATFTVRASSGEARAAVELHDELSSHSAQLTLATDLVLQTIAGIKSDHANFTGEVSMRDITLQYPDAPRPALRNVTCTIQAGTTVAIVGTTGSGKSTLADVILGVLSPDEGSVIVNGRAPMEAIQLWPGAIAYVPQEVALIEGSVRDNVALGLPRDYVEDALVWSALQRAHLADFLRETRSGLDTRVGEGGFRLSGGQRQRLGLARALYTRPRLLVLDEATSSLDSETENFITMSLAQLDKHVTKIVIAHRLATIRDADQVIYLEGGEVRAIGSFDALLQEVPDFLNQARLLGLA